MTDPLNPVLADINEAIAKHVPAQLGEMMRKRLTEAEQILGRNSYLETQVKKYQADEQRLKDQGVELDRLRAQVDAREQKIAAREAEVAKKELAAALIDLREKHANERVQELRGVVRDVFHAHTMQYKESVSKSVPYTGNHPQTMQVNENRTTEVGPAPQG